MKILDLILNAAFGFLIAVLISMGVCQLCHSQTPPSPTNFVQTNFDGSVTTNPWPGMPMSTNAFYFWVQGLPVCKGRMEIKNQTTGETLSFMPVNLPTGNYQVNLDLGLSGKTNVQFTVATVYRFTVSNLLYGTPALQAWPTLPFNTNAPLVSQSHYLCDNSGTNPLNTNTLVYESTNSTMWFRVITN